MASGRYSISSTLGGGNGGTHHDGSWPYRTLVRCQSFVDSTRRTKTLCSYKYAYLKNQCNSPLQRVGKELQTTTKDFERLDSYILTFCLVLCTSFIHL